MSLLLIRELYECLGYNYSINKLSVKYIEIISLKFSDNISGPRPAIMNLSVSLIIVTMH